jgi:fructose-1-phosphate kinase PfkB-like protein
MGRDGKIHAGRWTSWISQALMQNQAGDSMVAGITLGLARGWEIRR